MTEKKKDKMTSMKVTRFALDEINMRKGYLEWQTGNKLTVNDTLLELCKIFDSTYERPPKSKLLN